MSILKLLLVVYLIVMLVACAQVGEKLKGIHPRPRMPASVQEDAGTFIAAIVTTAIFAWLIFGHPAF